MPPSSRKRNKGKERKAKQQAKKEEKTRVCLRNLWKERATNSTCNHGCDIIPADGHPISNFMDEFYMNLFKKCMNQDSDRVIFKAMRHTLETQLEVWNNESYRKLAISIFIAIGTNNLLKEETSPTDIAHAIVLLEHYNGSGDIVESMLQSPVLSSKLRDLNPTSSSRRDCLKFYRKRTTCKCLKKLHLEARKTEPKVGLCYHCKEEKERASLSVCSRCMVYQYCSRECQVVDWPSHEAKCDLYSRRNKNNMARRLD